MINITLRQLRYFDALARYGHFGRAAEACAVSQPALSVQIRELEQTLGCALFERMPRQVRLTSLGSDFLERSQKILQSVDELSDLARAASDDFVGQLRIGVIPTIAPYLLPTIATQLSRQFVGVEIHVREAMTSTLLKELAEGKIDTAIVALPISEPSLTEVALFEEKFVLVRPEAEKGMIAPSLDVLSEMKLLLLEEGHCFRDQALEYCGIQKNRLRETLDATSLSTLVQMVGAGLGVTLIPEMAIAVETRSAAVSITRLDEPQPSRAVGMVWRKTNPLKQQYEKIAEAVRLATLEKVEQQSR